MDTLLQPVGEDEILSLTHANPSESSGPDDLLNWKYYGATLPPTLNTPGLISPDVQIDTSLFDGLFMTGNEVEGGICSSNHFSEPDGNSKPDSCFPQLISHDIQNDFSMFGASIETSNKFSIDISNHVDLNLFFDPGEFLGYPAPEPSHQLSSPPSETVSREPLSSTHVSGPMLDTLQNLLEGLSGGLWFSSSRIPSEARLVLEEHFKSCPYPSAEDIANIPGRKDERTKPRSGLPSTTSSAQTSNGNPRAPSIVTIASSKASKSSNKFSIERYLAAAVEDEPASALAISNAATSQILTVDLLILQDNSHDLDKQWNPDFGEKVGFEATSDIYSRSNASSARSSVSRASRCSYASSLGRPRRRGRRRYGNFAFDSLKEDNKRLKEHDKQLNTAKKSTVKKDETTFFCTFCGKVCASRYEWKRHEESVHVF
ncbi:hypothetical protein AOQ84DRAFT_380523 [Glonium stellatum]|uniref:C2H2-type domain-containing protein n=1 Tax=Glonium stellatum TaxID=574774 RepID=A0A8E2ETP8_9PEZI|nr:hypothetical protein AOQ84DRAFT_380523 [Glonium stellatum]